MNLSELIDTHRAGRSYTELERACGGAPSSKRLQQLARQPIKNFPDPETVSALARGLRVSPATVVLAAAESLGLDVSTSMPRLVELLPAGARHLTEEQAAAVAHLVRTIVEPDRRAGDGDDEDPVRSAAPIAEGDDLTPTVAGVLEERRRTGEMRKRPRTGEMRKEAPATHARPPAEADLAAAARRTKSGKRSAGQRRRDEMDAAGEESQDDA